MARSLRFVPAVFWHAESLAPRLRPFDVIECRMNGFAPLAGLLAGLDAEAWTAVDQDGAVVAMFGCRPADDVPGYAVPWMLAAPEIEQHGRALLREGRARVAGWLERYERLVNGVHPDNVRTIRWLERIGFVVDEPQAIDDMTIRPFVAGRPAHV